MDNLEKHASESIPVALRAVDRDNWRAVAGLKVSASQRDYVADPCYYLSLCHYGGVWQPMAIFHGHDVIGFMMWALDPADNACWLGGILIDESMQGRGFGRQAINAAVAMLSAEHGFSRFALSYEPSNLSAKHLYGALGFVETGAMEGDERVAYLTLGGEG